MKFHYDVIHNSFEGRYNVIYIATRIRWYTISITMINTNGTEKNKTPADLSDSVSDDLKDDQNTIVIGKLKDETNMLPITEFVAMNPNCYSVNHLKHNDTIKNTKKSKGVSK